MQDDYKVVYIHREKGKWIPIEEKPTEMASMYLITGKFADGEEFLHPINEHPQKASNLLTFFCKTFRFLLKKPATWRSDIRSIKTLDSFLVNLIPDILVFPVGVNACRLLLDLVFKH